MDGLREGTREVTQLWERYEKSRDYMNAKGLIAKTEERWRFYLGDQWNGVKSGGERFPVHNIIKPIVKYKCATVAHNSITARFSDADGSEENKEIFEALSRRFAREWEIAKMDAKSWDVIKAAAVQGDAYMYFGTERASDGQIIIDTSVLLGDEQESDLQEQPYVMIYERRALKTVLREAKENGLSDEEIGRIAPDSETQYVALGKDEIKNEGKLVSILYMDKDEDGIVRMARSTKTCVYEPLHRMAVRGYDGEESGGLSSYPLVKMTWEAVPNSARGMGQVEALIANQIEINKTLARRSVIVKMCAFPRLVYRSGVVSDADVLDTVGAKVELRGAAEGERVSDMISYIAPASMSGDAKGLSDDLTKGTQELEGAGDAATGQVNPERASGAAIMAVRDQAAMPLNEQVAAYKQFVEDTALLWLDMWAAYMPNGFSVRGESGEETVIGAEAISGLRAGVRVDVSPDNPWTKFAEQQVADNLFAGGHITFEEYLEAAPDAGPTPKGKLKGILAARGGGMPGGAGMPDGMQGGADMPGVPGVPGAFGGEGAAL